MTYLRHSFQHSQNPNQVTLLCFPAHLRALSVSPTRLESPVIDPPGHVLCDCLEPLTEACERAAIIES
jgi:hypothetical protein